MAPGRASASGSERVASYLVETYVPRGREGELEAAAGRACDAATRLTEEGRQIRFLRSTFVPDDELCFLIFEAESQALVAEAAARAEIEYERIVEAVE